MRPAPSPDRSLRRVAPWLAPLLLAGAGVVLPGCGGGGGSGGGSESRAAGSLTLTACVIAEGATSCQATIGWSSSNAASPRLVLGSTTLATAPSGSQLAPIGADTVTVTLFDGATRLAEASFAGTCVVASSWNGAQCVPFAIRKSERAATPFVEDGRPVTLEVVVYRPFGPGPHPALVFHHGSTGNGDDPSLFRVTVESQTIARFFTERGWLVAFPQRRGRGQSDGTYDEGFVPDRSRYSCLQGPALAGIERALADADAALAHVAALADADPARIVTGGHSRGGLLAVVHAGLRPQAFRGALNFVGGWLGEGCADAVAVNRSSFARGAAFPRETLWLYAQNDPFYSVAHSRANFEAFAAAGGKGRFVVHERETGLSGHLAINDVQRWGGDVEEWLAAAVTP